MTDIQRLKQLLIDSKERVRHLRFHEDYYSNASPADCRVAHHPGNWDKNRGNYWGFPYDHNLIKSIESYINASPIPLRGHRYIAAQGPRRNTFVDFWTMVWAEKVDLIVSVTNEVEHRDGQVYMKFDRFWPEEGFLEYGDFVIGLVENELVHQWDDGRPERLRQRVFQMESQGEKRFITHLHMENWEDNGVIHPGSLVALSLQIDRVKGAGTIVVHCAAGVGRTGTCIAFHSLYHDLIQALQERRDPSLDIVERIRELRALRWGAMVASDQQYALIIEALNQVIQEPV